MRYTFRCPSILLIILVVLSLGCMSGCSNESLTRAEQTVEVADSYVDRLEAMLAEALRARDTAERLAETVGSDAAKAAVVRAAEVIESIQGELPNARAAAEVARDTLADMKAANDSGGGWFGKAIAAISGGVGILMIVFPKYRAALLVAQQIVRGVDGIRAKMTPDQWEAVAVPALSNAQDQSTKDAVSQIQARNAALAIQAKAKA